MESQTSHPYSYQVAKFGGTSVADFNAIVRSAQIVVQQPAVRLVVLSASAGVTNLLVKLASGVHQAQQQALLTEIRQIQQAISSSLIKQQQANEIIEQALQQIAKLAQKVVQQPSTALADELVSWGEWLSSQLFVLLLQQTHPSTQWFDVRQVMVTDDQFGQAQVDQVQLQQRVQQQLVPLFAKGVVVTQGFIGCTLTGQTTTLGRGGSDYSAALLAEALHAEQLAIWTDVAGLYTTDPRIVANAKPIKQLTFAEAAEMATFGAKVLHPATLLPAIRCNIPVFVGSSLAAEQGGTVICQQTPQAAPLFRALALRRHQVLLTLHSLHMLHARGFLAEVFSVLAQHQISVDLITTSEVSVALTLDTTASTLPSDQLLTEELVNKLSQLCKIEIEQQLALVALIGNQLTQACGVAKQVFATLADFNVRLICYGASDHNLCFLVPEAQATEVIKRLHHHLFE